jgi:hypothetical protein
MPTLVPVWKRLKLTNKLNTVLTEHPLGIYFEKPQKTSLADSSALKPSTVWTLGAEDQFTQRFVSGY